MDHARARRAVTAGLVGGGTLSAVGMGLPPDTPWWGYLLATALNMLVTAAIGWMDPRTHGT